MSIVELIVFPFAAFSLMHNPYFKVNPDEQAVHSTVFVSSLNTAIFLFYIIYNISFIKADEPAEPAALQNCQTPDQSGNICLLCNTGYSLIEEGTNAGKCNACDQNKDGQSNHCFNKITDCTTYKLFKEGEKCIVCENGKELINERCVVEIPGCEQYKNDGTCNSCFPGYEYDNEDKTCIDNEGCKSTNDEDECTACIDGCYLEDNACICLPLCKAIQKKKCIECVNTKLQLRDGSDEETGGCVFYSPIEDCIRQNKDECEQCKEYYVRSQDKKTCSACDDSGSLKCPENSITDCTEVKYDTSKNLLVCSPSKCAEGKTQTKSNQQCTTGGSIQIGGETIALSDQLENCITHSKSGDDVVCSKCFPGFRLIDGECYQCPLPYLSSIGDGINCVLPHINCVDHDNSGNCIRCSNAYELKNGNCVEIEIIPRAKNSSYNLNLNIMILIIFGLLL